MAQRIDRGSCVLLGLNCMCKWRTLRKMMTNGKWREGSQKNSLKEKFGVFFLSFQSKSNNYINDSSGSGGGTHKMNCIPMAIILRGMLILAVLYSSVCLFHFVPFHFIPGRARSFLFFVLSLIISLYMLLLLYGCFGSVVLAFCARERQRNGLHSTAQHIMAFVCFACLLSIFDVHILSPKFWLKTTQRWCAESIWLHLLVLRFWSFWSFWSFWIEHSILCAILCNTAWITAFGNCFHWLNSFWNSHFGRRVQGVASVLAVALNSTRSDYGTVFFPFLSTFYFCFPVSLFLIARSIYTEMPQHQAKDCKTVTKIKDWSRGFSVHPN